MKKIGILTFHRTNNYGAVLQNYALQIAIKKEKENWKVETINYINENLEKPYKVPPFKNIHENLLKNVYYKFRYILNLKRYNRLCSKFDLFRKKYISSSKEVTASELISNSDSYDIYVTGSDQVWNDIITNEDPIYSLGFNTKAKKVSYAASAGSVGLIGAKTLKNIKEIDCISVRETELKDYLQDKLQRSISLVVDPVFLLRTSEWEEMISKYGCKQKYIFTYSVSEMTDEVVKIACHIAHGTKLRIYHLDHSIKYGFKGRCKYGASPLEFLEYIYNAELVIASSFHAVAFSIIFGKKFIVIPSNKTASRMIDLLKMIGAEGNIYSSYQDYIENQRPIVVADRRKLKPYIDDSLVFLKKL